MRVLLVSFLFAPLNNVGALRVSKTAKYLIAMGHEVRVVTAYHRGGDRSLPVEIAPENIAYCRWVDVNAWVGPTDAEVRGKPRHLSTEPERARPLAALALDLLKRAYRFATNIPDASVGWILPAVSEGVRIASTWKPDLVFASGHPWSSLVAGRLLARRLALPYVAELRDLWVGNYYAREYPVRRQLDRLLEGWVLGSADGVVTVSEPLARILADRYRVPTCVVANGFEPSAPYERSPQPSVRALQIVYTGRVYWGPQDPEPLLRALVISRKQGVEVHVSFFGPNVEPVADLASKLGVAEYVSVASSLPYEESLEAQANADVLLLLCWNEAADGVLPVKVFEYLGARRPILGVGRATDSGGQLVVERDAGVVAADAETIATQIQRWAEEKRHSGYVRTLPDSVMEGLTREHQTRILAGFLESLCRS